MRPRFLATTLALTGLLALAACAPVDIPAQAAEPGLWSRVSFMQFAYSVLGLVAGLACIVFGVVLFFNGVPGSVSWTTKFLGLQSQINGAAPGTILFLVGLFIIWITRFDIRARWK